MNRIFNGTLTVIMTIALVLVGSQAIAQSAICPISELKPGLKGYGKTVVQGTKVSTFDVEIIDIIKSGGYDGGDIILGRFSGPVIEISKGIAAGYSGSPVYFNGKLAGAVSGLIPYTDAHVGSITPIENMLDVFNQRFSPARYNNRLIGNSFEQLNQRFAASPVMISGVGTRGLSAMQPYLSRAFKNWTANFSQAQVTAKPGLRADVNAKPEPGSAIAAMICEGDIELSALGTLTHILPDGRFLAFGHPLSSNGEVDIPVSLAYVYHVFSSLERPFKEGSALAPIGRITADHMAGVGGKLNETSRMLPVHARFKDLDRNITTDINLRVLPDPDVFPMIAAMAISGKVGELIDRNPSGSISIKSSFMSSDLPTPYTFSDYYSGNDPLFIGIMQNAMWPSMLLANNSYKDVNLSSIEFEIQFTSQQQWAEINNVDIPLIAGVSEPKNEDDKADMDVDDIEESIDKAVKDSKKGKRSKTDGSISKLWGNSYLQDIPDMSGSFMYFPSMSQTIPPRDGKPRVVKPGTTIKLDVTIRPYRSAPFNRSYDFKIPEDCPEGFTTLIIRGGSGLLPTSDEFFSRTGLFIPTLGVMSAPNELRSFDEISKYILTLTPSNNLVIEMEKPSGESKYSSNRTWAEVEANKIKTSVPTDYIIVSGMLISIEVSKGEKERKSEPEPKPLPLK